ncbi:MAG: bifunctional diguanylate cyclase/phosphodiesterase [Chloroflexi bacterium]|nr:bifunctional diguanylate cyclase/phosphodiesterase [Chloroflexota bacterium]
MQASPDQDVPPGVQAEILDGRDSLRLVRIRLALTLVAVAIIPFAAVAPIARAVLDDTRTGLEERLGAEAEHAAAEVRRELTDIRATLETAAASEAAAAALAAPAPDPANVQAAAGLGALLKRPSGIVAGVVVASPGGIHARVGPATTAFAGIPPRANRTELNLVTVGGTDPALEIVVPILTATEGPATGWVSASIHVQDLLAWASPDAASAGRSVQLLGPNGIVLAAVGPADSINLPATVIDMAANGSELSEGSASIGLPQLDGWQVVAAAPLPVAAIPFPAVATLVGLLTLLVVFIWRMARQILRPAAELDARRARLHELYEVALEASLRDSLTGLGNHRAFQEAVTRMVDQSRRYGAPFALILLDIDDFKRVNDTRGHATGDELLAEVGNLIRATVRHADAGYRIGGDEFAILLASTNASGAEGVARRLLTHGLEDREVGRYRDPISFSAGVTACPELGSNRIELTAQADAALYRGKRTGRTVVNVFDAALDRGHVDEGMRAELSAAVAVVIETGVLTPVYQPIVELASGRVIGYEGLVRTGSETGFPNTGALFDAAEIAGRVLDLDRAALEVVLRGARRIPASTLISLNVSPRSFEVQEFNASIFLAILRRHEIAPSRVVLELTEREAIRDLDRLRSALALLQAAGIRVAADDVGAGNAGLRLLSQFRFDVVKIDLSLVQGGTNQGQTLSVLTSLVDLSRQWGALTIAEGVETAAQLQMIRQLGVDAGQGYLLGRPGTVIDAGSVDLDDLEAGPPSTSGPRGPILGATGLPVTSAPRQGVSGRLLIPVGAAAAPRSQPAAVPTAASIIAGGAPDPFAR